MWGWDGGNGSAVSVGLEEEIMEKEWQVLKLIMETLGAYSLDGSEILNLMLGLEDLKS